MLLICILFSGIVFAEISQEDTTWKGLIELNLSKTNFSQNEPITGTIRIHNQENYPIVGQRIVLQIAQGDYSYPSQLNSNDNIILEETINEIWVLPDSYVDVPFSLPNQGGGDFRIDLYSWVVKSKFIGSSSILMAPVSQKFSVEGQEREKDAIIHRELTIFEKRFVGPVGFPIESGQGFTGNIYVYNPTDKTKSNLKIGIKMCDWAIVFCETSEEKFFDVPSLSPGEDSSVVVDLTAPEIPSAYAMQITLYNGEKVESIYKSRVIVTGGTAKLRKIYLDGLATKNYSINIFYSGSPDHFTNPIFEDFSLGLEIFRNDEIIEEDSVNVDSIEVLEIAQQKFMINSKIFDKVCVNITKDSTIYEQECFNVPIEEIQTFYDEENPQVVQVNWTYNEKKEELEFTLTREEEMDARVFIITSDKTIYEKAFAGSENFTETIYLPKENYTMVVDDFIAKKQIHYDLFFNVDAKLLDQEIIGDLSTESKGIPQCLGTICEQGTVCAGMSYESIEGICCTTSCIQAINPLETQFLSIPLIFWVAIIFVIIAIFIGVKAIERLRK